MEQHALLAGHAGDCGQPKRRWHDIVARVRGGSRREVEKLISRSSFQLKGGGWYATGYARKGTGGESAKDKAGFTSSSRVRFTGTART